jgi:hypothetical protein
MYYKLFVFSLILLNSAFFATLCSFDNVFYYINDEEEEDNNIE